MKQTIKLRESELKRMISESVKRVLRESDELSYLSDQDIHKQYEGFEIDEFTIRPKKFRYGGGYGWEIGFAIHFPNVDHPDFDESRWENVDVWDEEGKRITWDGWYPEDISHQLIAMIRSEIQKHMREMQEFKEQTNQGFANETINRKIDRIVSESVKRVLRETAGHLYYKDEDGNAYTNSTETYRGVPDSTYIWHGDWSDPEIWWNGTELNATDVEDYLWYLYKDDCEEYDEKPTDEGYENWLKKQGVDWIASQLDDLAWAANGRP